MIDGELYQFFLKALMDCFVTMFLAMTEEVK